MESNKNISGNQTLVTVPIELMGDLTNALIEVLNVMENRGEDFCQRTSIKIDVAKSALDKGLTFLARFVNKKEAVIEIHHTEPTDEAVKFDESRTVSRPVITIDRALIKEGEGYEFKVVLPQIIVVLFDVNNELLEGGIERLTLKEIQTAFFKYGGSLIIGENSFDYSPLEKDVHVECDEDEDESHLIDKKAFNSIDDFLDFRL